MKTLQPWYYDDAEKNRQRLEKDWLVVIGIPFALWHLGSHVESDTDEARPGDME